MPPTALKLGKEHFHLIRFVWQFYYTKTTWQLIALTTQCWYFLPSNKGIFLTERHFLILNIIKSALVFYVNGVEFLVEITVAVSSSCIAMNFFRYVLNVIPVLLL